MIHAVRSVLLGTSLIATAGYAQAEVTDEDIRQSYHEKAALTQLLRWYQYYEDSSVGINNQLDILDADFSVTSSSGTATGHDEYAAAVKQFPASWQNAHDIKEVSVTSNDDNTLNMTAEIVYTNLGISDGLFVQRMGYTATLAYGDETGVLPKFTNMTITPLGAAEAEAFQSTYVSNRLTSLVTYWIYLVEHPDKNPELFREILASELDIKFTAEGDTYRTYDDIKAWVAGPASSLPATWHAMGPIQYSALGDDRYELEVSFDWQGIQADDKRMTAKTKHNWVVSDEPGARFARIEKIRVEIVEPFTVIE